MNISATNRLKNLRREELRRVAYEMAGQYGFQALTIEKIAQRAGISKGIIHHYFSNKDELVEHTVRYAHAIFQKGVRDRLKLARTPSERLWSVVDAYFTSEVFQPRYHRLWMSFFDESRKNPRLARLYEILDRRLDAHVFMAMRHLVPVSDLVVTATSILGLLDGFWLLAVSDTRFTAELALSNIAEYLRVHVPNFDMSAVTHAKSLPQTRPAPIFRFSGFRRQELLSAAFAVLKRHGLRATTITKIAEEADCSRGIVLHYFGNKEILLFALVRHVYELYRSEIAERLRAAKTPSERIWAIVSAHLDPKHLNRDNCNIWISIISETFTNSDLSRLQHIVRKRELSTLLHALRQISSEADAKNSASALMALMQACALWTGYITGWGSSQAIAMAASFLCSNVPGFDPAAVK
jgi:TetR/AcrR family transcriptional repressor of bet genes